MTTTPTTRTARRQLQALEASQRWADADRHLARGEWAAAVAAVQDLAADMLRCRRALSALASQITGRHWSPLLELASPAESAESTDAAEVA
jgi:hypothetical protein